MGNNRYARIALVFLISLVGLSWVLVAVSWYPSTKGLSGAYTSTYQGPGGILGTETLTIRTDGTYGQVYTTSPDRRVLANSGTWTWDGGHLVEWLHGKRPLRLANYVFLFSAQSSDDHFKVGPINSRMAVGRSPSGRLVITINDAKGIYYLKE